MAMSSPKNGITPGLAEHISRHAPLYREVRVKNKTYFNVRRSSDVVDAAQGFMNMYDIYERGLSQKDLALCECQKLLRARVLVMADFMRYRAIRRDPNCYLYLRLSPVRSRC